MIDKPRINWQIVLLAVITATPPTIVALGAFVQAKETHEAVNSRMTELLLITKKAATDAATLAEQAAEQRRQGEAAIQAQELPNAHVRPAKPPGERLDRPR